MSVPAAVGHSCRTEVALNNAGEGDADLGWVTELLS